MIKQTSSKLKTVSLSAEEAYFVAENLVGPIHREGLVMTFWTVPVLPAIKAGSYDNLDHAEQDRGATIVRQALILMGIREDMADRASDYYPTEQISDILDVAEKGGENGLADIFDIPDWLP